MRYLESALVTPSPKSVRRLSCLPAIAVMFCASHAFAAAPAVVVDAQQTLGRLAINGVSIIFPQALAINSINGNWNQSKGCCANAPNQQSGKEIVCGSQV